MIEEAQFVSGSNHFCLDAIRSLESMREKVDIFFMDPPYEAGYYSDAFEKIDTVSSRVDAIENTDTGDIYVSLYLTTLKYAIQREESDVSIQSEIDNLKNAIGK